MPPPIVSGSLLVSGLIGIVKRGGGLGRRGFALARSIVTAAPPQPPEADGARLDSAVHGGRLVSAWCTGHEVVDRAWRGSTVHRQATALAEAMRRQGAPDRVRLTGYALASALAANAAVTRFDVLAHVESSAVWALLAIAALLLIGKPAAIVAAWTDRAR